MAHTFTIDQKTILGMLSSMQPICTKRTTLDTTASILFQIGHRELILKSTDLEISLQSNCMLESSDIAEPQSFLVSGKRIFDLVKELYDQITFTFEDNQLSLQSDQVQLSLNIKDAETFPPFPERIENLMQLDAQFLVDMLEKVAFLIPQNNANPALNGLLLEISSQGLIMTTTDGHCLAQVHTPTVTLEVEKKWLLPRRAIFEIKKVLENNTTKMIFIGICGNQLVFSGESFNFFTKLLVDQFPHYQAILQKNEFMPALVDRTHFVKTLRRSACLLSGQFLATKFAFDKELLEVAMQNKEVGKLQETLPLHGFIGSQLDIRFYAPYLLNGLQAFPDAQIKFYLKSSSKPIIFESVQDAYTMTYLVMPVSPTNN
jgi:DNA polymerase-3 subunit beta